MTSSKLFATNNGNVYKKIMESVELKLREIDNRDFVISYTRKVVEILGEPEMSLEVRAGQICEDVTRLVESLGYQISDKKDMEGWARLKAVKTDR